MTTVEVHPEVNLLAGLITAAELHHEVFAELVQFVHGIVQEGFGIVAGPPKLGKSWWVLNLALAIAAGGYAFGKIKVEQRDVLYLALEDSGRRLQRRIRAVWGSDIPPHRLHLMTEVPPQVLHATITTWLMAHPGGLVILDTLGRARQQRRRGDDPYLADYQEGVALKNIVDAFPGSALLGVHHTRKAASDDFVDDLSGTLGLAGSADYVLVLRRSRGSNDASLQVTGRDAPEGEYAFTVDGGVWTLSGDGLAEAAAEAQNRRETKNLGDRAGEALRFVNGRVSTTPAELARHLNIDNKMAGTVLSKLYAADRIDRPCHGIYAPVNGESGETGETADSPLSPDSPFTERLNHSNSNDLPKSCTCGKKLDPESFDSMSSGQCLECRMYAVCDDLPPDDAAELKAAIKESIDTYGLIEEEVDA